MTLEDLHVVSEEDIKVDDVNNFVSVLFTPTIPHCSMATLIGLPIGVSILRALPPRFKVQLKIAPGSHFKIAPGQKQL